MTRTNFVLMAILANLAGCVSAPLTEDYYRERGAAIGKLVEPAEKALIQDGFQCWRTTTNPDTDRSKTEAKLLICNKSAGFQILASCWQRVSLDYTSGVIDEVRIIKPVCVGL